MATAAKITLNPQQTAILENFATAAGAIGNFSSVTVAALADGKLTGAESFEMILLAPGVVTAVKPILSQLKAWTYMSDDDKTTVFAAFAQRFDLTNDEAEKAIETIIASGLKIQSALDAAVKAIKSLRKLPKAVIAPAVAG